MIKRILGLLLAGLPFFLPCAADCKATLGIEEIKAYAAAGVKIEHLRKHKTVDWEKIETLFAKDAAKVVEKTDRAKGTDYSRAIAQALEQCRKGLKARVNQQILAKGLQHITVLNIFGLCDALMRGEAAAGPKISAFFEEIRPTFVRRDKDFFASAGKLEKTAELALEHLSQGPSEDLYTYKTDLENIILRTYALSVLYEIMEIEKFLQTNPDKCAVKQMEAMIFYRIIAGRVKRNSADAHNTITRMLDGSYSMMKASILEENLKKGLRGISLK
ncbi:MAG: hypothetical protein GY874_08890 [Desulfobacteraceae bacterium]|nr:hypothetical protein [Desulfobacteraceae bacterium]